MNRLVWRILGLPGYEDKVDLAREISRLQKEKENNKLSKDQIAELEEGGKELLEMIDPSIRNWRARG